MLIRRSVFDRFQYNPEAGIADDVWLLFEAVASGLSFAVIPEVLVEWRHSFTTKGYQPLSKSIKNIRTAKARIVKMLYSKDNLPGSISTLVRSPAFLRRFLKATDNDAFQILQAIAGHHTSDLEQMLFEAAEKRANCVGDKVRRHIRAVKSMGIMHVFQVARYIIDKHRLLGPTELR
jgi:hypothetical protein